jgi:hypothetical protein
VDHGKYWTKGLLNRYHSGHGWLLWGCAHHA